MNSMNKPQRPRRPKLKGFLTQPFLVYGAMVSCYCYENRILATGYLKLCSLSKDLGWVQVTEKYGKDAVGVAVGAGLVSKYVVSPFDVSDITKPTYALLSEPMVAILTSKKTSRNGRVNCAVSFATIDEMIENSAEWDSVLAGLERASSVRELTRLIERSNVA